MERRSNPLFSASVVAAAIPLGAVVVGGSSLPIAESFPVGVFLSYWWVFPASVTFASVALSTGISGALFFSPFFMLVVGLSPAQAIGAGLLTEVFGMGNGLRRYVSQQVVDYRTAKWLLAGAVPAVVAGAYVAHLAPGGLLKAAFGGGLILLGGFLLLYQSPEESTPGAVDDDWTTHDADVTVIEAADGETYSYRTCWRAPGVALSTAGGFVTGLISAGLPEVVTTQLIIRCRLPPRVAVATSVFVLGVAAFAGAVVHALSATPVFYIVGWSIPGVIVGSTIGTSVSRYVPSELMENVLGVVFALVGAFVLAVQFFA